MTKPMRIADPIRQGGRWMVRMGCRIVTASGRATSPVPDLTPDGRLRGNAVRRWWARELLAELPHVEDEHQRIIVAGIVYRAARDGTRTVRPVLPENHAREVEGWLFSRDWRATAPHRRTNMDRYQPGDEVALSVQPPPAPWTGDPGLSVITAADTRHRWVVRHRLRRPGLPPVWVVHDGDPDTGDGWDRALAVHEDRMYPPDADLPLSRLAVALRRARLAEAAVTR